VNSLSYFVETKLRNFAEADLTFKCELTTVYKHKAWVRYGPKKRLPEMRKQLTWENISSVRKSKYPRWGEEA